jgi:hypothetical protein
MKLREAKLFVTVALTIIAAPSLSADAVIFDEFGNAVQNHFPPENAPPGTFAPVPACTADITTNCFETALEPISGLTTLVFHLQFGFTDGDVFLTEPGSESPSDLLRFENGTDLFVFSEPNDEILIAQPRQGAVLPLADISFGVPGPSGENQLTIAEVGDEGNNGVTYTPGRTEPGFTDFPGGLDYVFKSDGTVPEPSSLSLVAVGSGLLFVSKRWHQARRRSKMWM